MDNDGVSDRGTKVEDGEDRVIGPEVESFKS